MENLSVHCSNEGCFVFECWMKLGQNIFHRMGDIREAMLALRRSISFGFSVLT